MKQLNQLIDGIVRRVNANLREYDFNTGHFVHSATDPDKMLEYCASYEATSKSPLQLNFRESNIAGSYFLGKCRVNRSVVYKSDVRGDELNKKGNPAIHSKRVTLDEDEIITINNSFLFKILIHSKSYNPETPEEFFIKNTVAAHYSTIHGSTLEGCYLGAFATVDRTALHACIVGGFSYVQAGELYHREITPGTVWVENENFSFRYTYPKKILDRYIALDEAFQPTGVLYEFAEERKTDLERVPEQITPDAFDVSSPCAINRFAVIKGKTEIGKRVSICQRAYIENAEIGDGSTVQENAYIINSKLSNFNITAHGGKVIHCVLGMHVFTGMNCFLNGKENAGIVIGEGSIIMPHTIIDPVRPIEIPADRLVWGFIGTQEDVKTNSISLTELKEAKKISMGKMVFEGNGGAFVKALRNRIELALESKGASDAEGTVPDRIQDSQNTSVLIIQPYGIGPKVGIYPTIKIENQSDINWLMNN